jgi:hypothetical protein
MADITPADPGPATTQPPTPPLVKTITKGQIAIGGGVAGGIVGALVAPKSRLTGGLIGAAIGAALGYGGATFLGGLQK